MVQIEKKAVNNIAKLLHDNGLQTTSYNDEAAMTLLIKNGASNQTIQVFSSNSFNVFMELMRIETTEQMHNMFKPL